MTVESCDLVWRPLAVSDGAALADLLNAVDAADQVRGQYTEQDATEELDSPFEDLATSTPAVFDGATMLGFSAVHYKPVAEVVHRVHAAGAVRPDHRRRGLGTKLMQHGFATAEGLHALHHPTLRLVVESTYGEHVYGSVALYRAAGMTATRWSRHLRHPLGTAIPDAPVPDGLRVEGYTAETDEDFRSVCNDAQDALGRSQLSAEEWKLWATNINFRPESSFLLRDSDTGTATGVLLVVSWEAETAATGVGDAYFRVVATRPAYQEHGVAEALISHTLRARAGPGLRTGRCQGRCRRIEQRPRGLRECRIPHPGHPGPLLHRTLTVDPPTAPLGGPASQPPSRGPIRTAGSTAPVHARE